MDIHIDDDLLKKNDQPNTIINQQASIAMYILPFIHIIYYKTYSILKKNI